MQQYVNFRQEYADRGNWGTVEKPLLCSGTCFQIFLSKLPATVLVNLYSSLMAVPSG